MKNRVSRWYMLIRAESDYSRALCYEHMFRVHYIWKGCARHARSVYSTFACRIVNGIRVYYIAGRVCRTARVQFFSANNVVSMLCLLECGGICYSKRPKMVVCHLMWKLSLILKLSLVARLHSSVDCGSKITDKSIRGLPLHGVNIAM